MNGKEPGLHRSKRKGRKKSLFPCPTRTGAARSKTELSPCTLVLIRTRVAIEGEKEGERGILLSFSGRVKGKGRLDVLTYGRGTEDGVCASLLACSKKKKKRKRSSLSSAGKGGTKNVKGKGRPLVFRTVGGKRRKKKKKGTFLCCSLRSSGEEEVEKEKASRR